MLHAVSQETVDIASKYNINTGKYLLPASEKVSISNWLNPTFDDYKIIQNYLSTFRSELSYLNYPGTDLREKRLQNFKLITDEINPRFGVIYFNNAPNDKKNCIITYISCDEGYIKHLNALLDALKRVGFNGHFIFRIGGWPATQEGTLELFDVPYAFKIFSFLEAKTLGYKNCLWLDACMLPLQGLDAVFKDIERNGVFVYSLEGYSYERHIQPFAAEALGTTITELLRLKPLTTITIGLDLTNASSLKLLDEWHEIAKEKLGFLSYIPEMATLCFLIDKFNLTSFMSPLYHPYTGIPDSRRILIWNHNY